MADVVIVDGAPEVVVSLAASLETPNEPELTEEQIAAAAVVAADAVADVKVADATVVVEDKIADAVADGASKEDINELRGLLRELRNDNISLQTRLSAAERVQKGEFGKEGTDVNVSELEEAQAALVAVANRDFTEILAVMEVNPKYEDVRTVCSKAHFDDIFENVAKHRSSINESDFNVELVKAKAEIWALPNPYKYMYEVVKEHHPDYAKAPAKVDATVDDKKPADTSAKAIVAKQVVAAPGSVASFGGGDETKAGWTSEKIDSMPESQLHTVPKDVYKKWLSGDLD